MPSLKPAPFALSAKDLHRPSGARPRWREKPTNTPGVVITVTPPASASEHSSDRNAWLARCSATSEEEHAVSTETAGPSKPNVYATRPDKTLLAVLVSPYPSRSPDADWFRPTP